MTAWPADPPAGAFTADLHRRGDRIPDVAPTELLLRLGYELPAGPLQRLVPMSNPRRRLLHRQRQPGDGAGLRARQRQRPSLAPGRLKPFRDVNAYVEVRNVAGTTYVTSANNLTRSIRLRL